MAPNPSPLRPALALGLFFLGACKGTAPSQSNAETEAKGPSSRTIAAPEAESPEADAPEPLAVTDLPTNDPGPVPPATSMVFYVVEGALLPLGCFDQPRKALRPGSECLDLPPPGAEVRLSAGETSVVKTLGEPTEPLCTRGEGRKTARAIPGLTTGANFEWAVWPRSTFKEVVVVPDETVFSTGKPLDGPERTALAAAIKRVGQAEGELVAHQIARLPAAQEGSQDLFYSVFVTDPAAEEYRFSGIFLAPGGNLERLQLLEQSRSKKDVFEVRGALDLDGNGTRELWLRMIFDEGAGDALVRVDAQGARRLGSWSCGA
jgi:hypothetical protein